MALRSLLPALVIAFVVAPAACSGETEAVQTHKPSFTSCGDGVVHEGEECDDGNADDEDGCTSLCQRPTVSARGDGFVELGAEECDDGNAEDGDGCHNDCTLNQSADLSCPGQLLMVENGIDTTVSGDTSASKDNWNGSCGGDGAPDVVYEVEPL